MLNKAFPKQKYKGETDAGLKSAILVQHWNTCTESNGGYVEKKTTFELTHPHIF